MAKAHDAFRTISEVSEALDTPTHVLRFWESKFNQIKPVKRAGGRRYYRPDDLALLAGIKDLLHEQGMTIKGAQKLLREKGVKYAVALGQNRLDGGDGNSSAEIIDLSPSVPAGTDENAEVEIAEEAIAPQAAATPPAPAPTAPAPTAPTPTATLFSAPSAATPVAPKVADPAPTLTAVQDIIAEQPDVAPIDETAAPEEKPAPPVNMPPAKPKATFPQIAEPRDIPARFFGSLRSADVDAIRANSAQIAPLIARLEAVRDQLRRV
jgi:DNA-binding transcriptional MerR regulator